MPSNLFISYDLNNPGQNYSAVIEKIKSLGGWANVQKSFWFLSTSLTAQQVANALWSVMDANDSLIVIDANANDAYWFNLDPAVSKYIQDNWAAKARVA